MNLKNVPDEAIQVLEIIEELFENQLIGVYLYGSAILGGLQSTSDIDILVICNQGLSETARKKLTARLLLISGRIGCKTKRPLEVTIINQNDILAWQFPPKYEYMYGEWLREQIEAGDIPQARYDPDVVILLWQARRHSYPLKGQEATETIKSVPIKDVQKAIGCSLPDLIAGIKGDERNVLLTLARMWFMLSNGETCSKDMAAEWAIPRLPRNLAPLLEAARTTYLGERDDSWSGLETEIDSLVSFMSNSIDHQLDDMKNLSSSS